jgi:DNA replication protein DnaC
MSSDLRQSDSERSAVDRLKRAQQDLNGMVSPASGLNVLLVGPSGAGKTTIVAWAAEDLGFCGLKLMFGTLTESPGIDYAPSGTRFMKMGIHVDSPTL